jgi:hypothetical protein
VLPFEPPTLPEVPGDPAGMRALASSLRADGALIATIATSLEGRVDTVEFVGPAATRFEGRMGASVRRCVRVAERLIEAAALLERSAAEVEAAQRERERRLTEMRAEALAAHREATREMAR